MRTVSPETLAALANGQVDELIISATVEQWQGDEAGNALREARAPEGASNERPPSSAVIVADELVTRARQSTVLQKP